MVLKVLKSIEINLVSRIFGIESSGLGGISIIQNFKIHLSSDNNIMS